MTYWAKVLLEWLERKERKDDDSRDPRRKGEEE
jgi:hypothetical protein